MWSHGEVNFVGRTGAARYLALSHLQGDVASKRCGGWKDGTGSASTIVVRAIKFVGRHDSGRCRRHERGRCLNNNVCGWGRAADHIFDDRFVVPGIGIIAAGARRTVRETARKAQCEPPYEPYSGRNRRWALDAYRPAKPVLRASAQLTEPRKTKPRR